MDVKNKYRVEYEIKSSPKILFNFISTPSGLAEWFSDDVTVRDSVYGFVWDGDKAEAKLLGIKDNRSVKFKWVDDEPYCFFEFEIMQDELTGDVALAITDFCTDSQKEEELMIWANRIDTLIHVLGA